VVIGQFFHKNIWSPWLSTKDSPWLKEFRLWDRANILIVSYSAALQRLTTSSLVRFGNTLFSSTWKKRSTVLQCWRCSCKFMRKSYDRGLQRCKDLRVHD
jgi:hypothetical protein